MPQAHQNSKWKGCGWGICLAGCGEGVQASAQPEREIKDELRWVRASLKGTVNISAYCSEIQLSHSHHMLTNTCIHTHTIHTIYAVYTHTHKTRNIHTKTWAPIYKHIVENFEHNVEKESITLTAQFTLGRSKKVSKY